MVPPIGVGRGKAEAVFPSDPFSQRILWAMLCLLQGFLRARHRPVHVGRRVPTQCKLVVGLTTISTEALHVTRC